MGPMKLKFLFPAILVTLAALVLGLSGCSLPMPGSPKAVSIDLSYDGKQLTVSAGEVVNIALYTRPPDTGWKLISISNDNVIRYESNALATTNDNAGEVPCTCGTPGDEIWVFKALKPGTADIHMEYGLLAESSYQPAATFDLSVVVE